MHIYVVLSLVLVGCTSSDVIQDLLNNSSSSNSTTGSNGSIDNDLDGDGIPDFGEQGEAPSLPNFDSPTPGIELSLAPGEVVAKLTMDPPVPLNNSFIVHGTIPLPPNTYPTSDGKELFGIIDHAGNIEPAQTDIVSRYANFDAGADVVELSARVNGPFNIVGGKLSFDVIISPYTGIAKPSGSSATALLLQANLLDPDVVDLLTNHSQEIKMVAEDYYGNIYEARLLSPSNPTVLKKWGPTKTEVRTYSLLQPKSGNPGAGKSYAQGGEMPQLMGIHAYFTAMKTEEGFGNEQSLLLDVRINNGPTSNPLGHIYFKHLRLETPNDWKILHFVKTAFTHGNELIDSIKDSDDFCYKTKINKPDEKTYCYDHSQGDMHVFPMRSIFERRMIITHAGNNTEADNRAKVSLTRRGIAFATAGNNASGDELLSWWNPGSSRYFSQKFPLASIMTLANNQSFVAANLESDLKVHADNIRLILETGSELNAGFQMNPDNSSGESIVYASMGPFYPLGSTGGGGTGGGGVAYSAGELTLAAASYYGFEKHLLTDQMITDRQISALFNNDGTPFDRNDYLIAGQNTPWYIPFSWNMGFTGNNDPAGYSNVPNPHMAQIAAAGDIANYALGFDTNSNGIFGEDGIDEQGLVNFAAHDQQHFLRATSEKKAIIYTANSSMAKDDLELYANLHLMQEREYAMAANSLSTQSTNIGLLNKIKDVYGLTDNINLTPYWNDLTVIPPGNFPQGRRRGLHAGRDYAWSLDTISTYYGLAPKSWRQQNYGWFEKSLNVFLAGQSACSGFWGRSNTDKLNSNLTLVPKAHAAILGEADGYDAKYYAVNTWQDVYLQQGWRGAQKTVFENKDATEATNKTLTNKVHQMLYTNSLGLTQEPIWGRAPKLQSGVWVWQGGSYSGKMGPTRTAAVSFDEPGKDPYNGKPWWLWTKSNPPSGQDPVSGLNYDSICAPFPSAAGTFTEPVELGMMGIAESHEFFFGYNYPIFVWGYLASGEKHFLERAAEHQQNPGSDYPIASQAGYNYQSDSLETNMQDFLNHMTVNTKDHLWKIPAIGFIEQYLDSL